MLSEFVCLPELYLLILHVYVAIFLALGQVRERRFGCLASYSISAAFFLSIYALSVHPMSSNNTGPIPVSCEYRKMESHTLLALASDGSAVTEADVIVINPFDDNVCTLQCEVGYYEPDYGNKAPFLCAPNTTDRTSREGLPTYPINCTSA